MITEAQLEQITCTWFQDLGWLFSYGSEIAPDGPSPQRESWSETVLRGTLLSALARINPHLTPEALEQAVHAVESISDPALVGRNRAFHRMLIQGVPVTVERNERLLSTRTLRRSTSTHSG